MRGLHVCFAGPFYKIRINGKMHHFEDTRASGPMPLRANGEPTNKEPSDAFWHAVTCWAQQGRKAVNDWAVWANIEGEVEG